MDEAHRLDLTHPGLNSWRDGVQAVEADRAKGLSMPTALNRLAASLPIARDRLPRFVAQSELPDGVAYEAFVHDQRAVPTRENWHDGFNALCWMRLPELKWHFNRLQAEALMRNGVQAQRGPVRDALTVLDENGMCLQISDEVWAAIRAHDWTRAFVDLRSHWAQARWVIMGHALLDNLTRPFKGITAHVMHWPTEWGDDEDRLAKEMVNRLSAEALMAKPFTPLPVMGIPNWMPGQGERAFYADERVFRKKKSSTNPVNKRDILL